MEKDIPMGKHSEPYLSDLASHALRATETLFRKKRLSASMGVAAICLYGSAAQVHFSQKPTFNDHDIQIFLRRKARYQKNDVARLNRHGAAWFMGMYEGKKVEAFFGLLYERDENLLESIREYVKHHKSPRWDGHRKKPFLVIWPLRADWLTVV